MPAPRVRPTRNASGLFVLLNALGWHGRDAAERLGISHPTLIGLRDATQRPGQVTIDTVCDRLRAEGFKVDPEVLFPRDDQPPEACRGTTTSAAG